MPKKVRLVTSSLAALMVCGAGFAQGEGRDYIEVKIDLDSSYVENVTGERAVIFSTVVEVPATAWLMLLFDQAELGDAPPGGEATILRVTSVLNGAVQDLHAVHLRQWQNTSARFSGDALIVEIVADPGAAPSRLNSVSIRSAAPPMIEFSRMIPASGDSFQGSARFGSSMM